MAENAQNTTFTFNSQSVGGVESWTLQEGQVRESTFRPLSGAPAARPLAPDYGNVILNLYRDASDSGQESLRSSLKNRTISTMTITHPNGEVDTFRAFCTLFPMRGSKSNAAPITLTRCVIRVDGEITTA